MPSPSTRTLAGILVVCFASLLLEVVLTRIFSATMYYHFTFLAIALALFGVGASGVYVYVRSERFTAATVEADLTTWAARFAGATVLALVYVLANPIEIIGGHALSSRTGLQVFLLCGATALPFFAAGMVVSLAVTHYREQIDRVYFFDLCGAGLAALLAGLLLRLLGGPGLVLLTAVIAAVASLIFSWRSGTRRVWPLYATAALLIVNLRVPIIATPSVKGVDAGRLVFERWNSFSRITVEEMKNGLSIKIDASAATSIIDSAEIRTRSWQGDISALAFALFPSGAPSALVIGPGGGNDVVNALASGAAHVTGVEVNPIIAETIMRGRFRDRAGDLYGDPRVHVVTDEGRSFIRRADERWDVILATLVDTWAATAAGAFALTENTLYTVEAFEDYYDHLTDDGVVTMNRWYRGGDPESQRLVLLAAGALERRGVPPGETRKHLYFAHDKQRGTLIAKRTELTAEELSRLDALAAARSWTVELSPTTPGSSPLESMVNAGAWSRRVRAERKDLTPPSDDRPFFFYFVKPRDLWSGKSLFGKEALVTDPAVWLLLALGATVIALALAFIVLPLALYRRSALAGGGPGSGLRRALGLGYFALLGLAFITVEIALLQKLAFFLGHPSHALVVVLFAILAATAVGARLSGRIPDARRGQAALVCGLVLCGLGTLYALTLGGLLRSWVAWPFSMRVLLSGAVTASCGLLMGVMLPSGVTILARRDAALVPWAWGVNGATSVVGTVLATVVAIQVGFSRTLLFGALAYAVAGLVGLALARRTEA